MENKEIPKGYMQDARGNLVLIKNVKPIDKERDRLVKELWEKAAKLEQELEAFRANALEKIQDLIQKSADEYSVNMGGRKGNVSLTSFDGQLKVVRAINEKVAFTEQIQVAQSLINEYLHDLTKGSKTEIKAIINNAFQIDKEGNISASRILGLRRIHIQHEKWQQAMNIISDAVKIESSKEYVRFYKRKEDGSFAKTSMGVNE